MHLSPLSQAVLALEPTAFPTISVVDVLLRELRTHAQPPTPSKALGSIISSIQRQAIEAHWTKLRYALVRHRLSEFPYQQATIDREDEPLFATSELSLSLRSAEKRELLIWQMQAGKPTGIDVRPVKKNAKASLWCGKCIDYTHQVHECCEGLTYAKLVKDYAAKNLRELADAHLFQLSANKYWKFCVAYEFPKVCDEQLMGRATDVLIKSVPREHLDVLIADAERRGLLQGRFSDEEVLSTACKKKARHKAKRHYALGKRRKSDVSLTIKKGDA
jgi:hypothetical protein